MDDQPEPPPPLLRIVRGKPSVEEIAALVAVLSAAAGARATAATAPRYAWSARSRFLRAPLSPGPGEWRASAATR
ncbi:hypothetical protein BH24ACT9_BH24ACT9_17760 [soil metagenome]